MNSSATKSSTNRANFRRSHLEVASNEIGHRRSQSKGLSHILVDHQIQISSGRPTIGELSWTHITHSWWLHVYFLKPSLRLVSCGIDNWRTKPSWFWSLAGRVALPISRLLILEACPASWSRNYDQTSLLLQIMGEAHSFIHAPEYSFGSMCKQGDSNFTSRGKTESSPRLDLPTTPRTPIISSQEGIGHRTSQTGPEPLGKLPYLPWHAYVTICDMEWSYVDTCT